MSASDALGGHGGIRAVLWDYGGVFTPSPFHAMDGAPGAGAEVDAMVDLVLGYSLPDGDHPWHRVERGEITLATAAEEIRGLVADAGLGRFSFREFFGTMRPDDAGPARDQVFAAVQRLRDAGVTNIVVSNNVAEFAEQWLPTLPAGLFDDIVDSSAVGVRKPDPAIFRLALERAGEPPPGEVAFLDDHLGNVEAANALGIRGVHVGADPMVAVDQLLAMAGLG